MGVCCSMPIEDFFRRRDRNPVIPQAVLGDVLITHVKYWRPIRFTQVPETERDGYQWNEDPPANAKKAVFHSLLQLYTFVENISDFSHIRVYLENGKFFNVWGAKRRWCDPNPRAANREQHLWFSDLTTPFENLGELLSLDGFPDSVAISDDRFRAIRPNCYCRPSRKLPPGKDKPGVAEAKEAAELEKTVETVAEPEKLKPRVNCLQRLLNRIHM